MTAFYNEIDHYAAQWLRNLIDAGHIAPGVVDERSIVDIDPAELRGYTQCHFFAGIGGWSYALRLAGVPDGMPLWTGSCPCQPFSNAGKKRGSNDARHLWPAFCGLIRECRPGTVLGEQVAGTDGLAWWDHVAADLEGEGYAAAAASVPACAVGAPHIRQRLWWVASHADAGLYRPQGRRTQAPGTWEQSEFARLVADQLRVSAPAGRYAALDDGIPGAVGRLRAYGNAIVPQVGAAFIEAVMQVSGPAYKRPSGAMGDVE